MPLKYIFMGTPALAATILETLCEKLYPPDAVVTQVAKATGRGQKIQPSAVEMFARQENLTLLSALDVNAPATVEALKVFEPDLVLVAAFGQILKNDILSLPKLYCLNVHASLLPKYRGAAPVQMAIWDGEKKTGITIQKMAKRLDTGDILLQKELEIAPEETSGELMARLAQLGGEALVEAVRLIEKGEEKFIPQDSNFATYARKIDKADALLDFSKSATILKNQIRALQPWPVAETTLNGERLKVFSVDLCEGKAGLSPGDIVTDSKSFLRVQCGNHSALALTVVQLENRKKLGIQDFLKAYRGSFPYHKMGSAT